MPPTSLHFLPTGDGGVRSSGAADASTDPEVPRDEVAGVWQVHPPVKPLRVSRVPGAGDDLRRRGPRAAELCHVEHHEVSCGQHVRFHDVGAVSVACEFDGVEGVRGWGVGGRDWWVLLCAGWSLFVV